MTPNWMPQNIQKRLLLYVLQQLSLFSEIDLPNLDVSLGSSSQVSLSDVEIDTEAFQIPGVYLRNGRVKSFQLTLNVSGGVSVEADGLVLTVALASSSNTSTHKSKFSLAQSTMDLANSIIQDGEFQDSDLEFQTPAHSIHEEVPTTDTAEAQPSALNSMMSKAIEAALSRLQVTIKNISVRIIMDQATIDAEIKEARMSTMDGVRTVDVSDIMVLGVDPITEPGEVQTEGSCAETVSGEPTTDDTEVQRVRHDDMPDNPSSDSEDEGDDDNQKMMSSSVLQRSEDLNSSLLYSKEEASSIYMSAASDVFESRRRQVSASSRLAFLNKATVAFSGLTEVDDLKVVVDEVRIAATPIPLTLLHVVESLGVMTSNYDFSRSSNINSKVRHSNDGEAREKQLLDEIVVNKLSVNLVSALNDTGSFSKPLEATIVTKFTTLKQLTEERFYGSLSEVILEKNGSTFGSFDGSDKKGDVRFEMNTKTGDFTLLLGKDLTLSLEQDVIQTFLNLSSYSSQIFESLSRNRSHQPTKKPTQGATTIQTSLIVVNLDLSDQKSLRLNISPISYDSKEGTAFIKKAVLYTLIGDTSTTLVSLMDICHETYAGNKQLRTYDNNGHEVVLLSNSSVSIDSVVISHDWKSVLGLMSDINLLKDVLTVVNEEVVFKTRKKARIFSNLMFQSRLSVKMLLNIKSLSFKFTKISETFGDLTGRLDQCDIMMHQEGHFQLHVMKADCSRSAPGISESLFTIINPDDKSAPILSLRTRDFKTLNVLLRNSTLEYHTKWLGIFDVDNNTASSGESSHITLSNSDNLSSEPKLEIKLNLIDSAIGLNPGRLTSKANLVIPSGNFDVIIGQNTIVKSELRGSSLVLIDDVSNIATYEETKANRGSRASWSQVSYFNAKGYSTVAKLKSLSINVLVKQTPSASYDTAEPSSAVFVDLSSSVLEVDLCADSSHCLVQLANDLKQPITIRVDARYKTKRGKEINVFDGVDDDAFNSESLLEEGSVGPVISQEAKIRDEPLDIVESYYDTRKSTPTQLPGILDDGSDILDKDLNELKLTEKKLNSNPFFAADQSLGTEGTSGSTGDLKSDNSDSIILFNDGHFAEKLTSSVRSVERPYPMNLSLHASKVIVKIHDGYDWKHTRKTISQAVKRIEQRAREQKERMATHSTASQNRGSSTSSRRVPFPEIPDDQILGETLFESIHVSLPVTSDPATLTAMINREVQNKLEQDDTGTNGGIDVGKSNVKKLKLRRSKTHKVLVELSDINVDFTLFSNKEPLNDSSVFGETVDFEIVSELSLRIRDFEVTDNVPTSTWNKFVTYMRDEDRESGSKMFSLSMKTVRPVSSLAATEILMDVNVLPLRLHVDQDTLEVLTRFGEFKDARFALVDEFEDLAYIQKFTINSVHIKLDYKPKKIDYAGLRSGHTTEFMNFFILDEADMILKSLTLHGISGFPRLGVTLNGLWMPDIKSTQLTGVLTGLAPVRSIAKIGTGFKDLIAVPVKEYQKDGRFYRSFSKGVQQFSKTTTNEMIKLGVKLAAGTQAILEHTEEAFGGSGAAGRVGNEQTSSNQRGRNGTEYDSEDLSDDGDGDEDSDSTLTKGYGVNSHLIGRGALASSMIHRSVYQPTLESIADINQQQRRQMSRANAPDDFDLVENSEYDEVEGVRMVSLYANQPTSIKEGFLLAYDSLGRNLLVAKDAILTAGTEIGESGSARDTTMAVMKATPVVLLRPVIGATEAASKALLGINNQLDPGQRKYTEDKYKQNKQSNCKK